MQGVRGGQAASAGVTETRSRRLVRGGTADAAADEESGDEMASGECPEGGALPSPA